jgi:hypothetical protein
MIVYLNCYKPDSQKTWTKADYLIAAADFLGISHHIKLYQGEPNPEYVINIEPFQRFIKGTKWTAIYEIDMTFDRQEMNLSNWIASDMVFVANSNLPSRMEAYQGPKTLLFQACDPSIHRRITSIKPQYDFVFSGSNDSELRGERNRTMTLLRKHGFTFCDFGKEHPLLKYVEYLNQGRVQFIRSANKEEVAMSQVEQRFFECLAIGPVLKDYHPDLEKLNLVEGEDFFWYKNDDEMLLKMRHLIDNPKFASVMAKKGREKSLQYHSYFHRLVTIINLIKEHDQTLTFSASQ